MRFQRTTSPALLLLALCLITACSAADAPPATTTTSTSNPTLIANAGPDQSVFIGTFVTLNGSKSTNANGTGLTYSWTLKKPAGSNATLSNSTLVNPTMTVDIGGIYEATLIVRDAQNAGATSTTDTAIVIASGTNPPPVANAGSNQNVFVGQPVLLSGSGSSDANRDPLTFTWSFSGLPASSTATLLDRTTVAASLTPDIEGTYIIQLVVNDGTSSSAPAFVTVIASNKPSPTADAGSDRFIALNTPSVTLNGSSSHTNPSGDQLKYAWSFNYPIPAPTITQDPDSPMASFIPPANVAATYVAQLIVTEPNHPGPLPATALDTVSITVGPLASITVSKATPLTFLSTCTVTICPSVPVQQNTQLILNGSASLVQPLTYQWSMSPTTGATLANTTSAIATFTPGLNVTGNFTITLTVQDGGNHTHSQSVTINVVTGPVVQSIGVSGSSFLPNTSVPVTASISGVTGTPTCTWTPSSPNVVITPLTCTATSATASIRASQAGSYTPSLTVTDTVGNGSRQFVFNVNTPPTITSLSSTNNTPGVCTTNTVSWNATDADGDPVTVSWQVTPPSSLHSRGVYVSQILNANIVIDILNVSLSNPAFFNPSASATGNAAFMPDVDGTYTLTLTAHDSRGGSSLPSTLTLGATRLSTSSTTLINYQNSGCTSCHSLNLWGIAGGSTGPDHSGKGLQALQLDSFSHTGGTVSINHQALCNLFNDYDHP